MNFTRPALAVTAALSLTLLAGCAAAATPEEQAVQGFQDFVAALNGDGEIAWCDAGAAKDYDLGAWKLVDGEEITAEEYEPGAWGVRAETQLVGGDERVEENSLNMLIPEDGTACVEHVYGFFNITG